MDRREVPRLARRSLITLSNNNGFSAQELHRINRLASTHLDGMNTVANNDPRIAGIEVSEDAITARLVDGRVISVPLVW